jgi:hypothetical protein
MAEETAVQFKNNGIECVAWDFDMTILTIHANQNINESKLNWVAQNCVSRDFVALSHALQKLGIHQAIMSHNDAGFSTTKKALVGENLIRNILKSSKLDTNRFFIVAKYDQNKNYHLEKVMNHFKNKAGADRR